MKPGSFWKRGTSDCFGKASSRTQGSGPTNQDTRRTQDGDAMGTKQDSCTEARCKCKRGGAATSRSSGPGLRPAVTAVREPKGQVAKTFGPPHRGEYTIWLVGFSGKAWVPVALVEATSWFVAREEGEKLYPWVVRGQLEASSGNRLSLFESNATESAARYVERQASSHTTSVSSRAQPHRQTLTPSASSGPNSRLVGGVSPGLRLVLSRSGVQLA